MLKRKTATSDIYVEPRDRPNFDVAEMRDRRPFASAAQSIRLLGSLLEATGEGSCACDQDCVPTEVRECRSHQCEGVAQGAVQGLNAHHGETPLWPAAASTVKLSGPTNVTEAKSLEWPNPHTQIADTDTAAQGLTHTACNAVNVEAEASPSCPPPSTSSSLSSAPLDLAEIDVRNNSNEDYWMKPVVGRGGREERGRKEHSAGRRSAMETPGDAVQAHSTSACERWRNSRSIDGQEGVEGGSACTDVIEALGHEASVGATGQGAATRAGPVRRGGRGRGVAKTRGPPLKLSLASYASTGSTRSSCQPGGDTHNKDPHPRLLVSELIPKLGKSSDESESSSDANEVDDNPCSPIRQSRDHQSSSTPAPVTDCQQEQPSSTESLQCKAKGTIHRLRSLTSLTDSPLCLYAPSLPPCPPPAPSSLSRYPRRSLLDLWRGFLSPDGSPTQLQSTFKPRRPASEGGLSLADAGSKDWLFKGAPVSFARPWSRSASASMSASIAIPEGIGSPSRDNAPSASQQGGSSSVSSSLSVSPSSLAKAKSADGYFSSPKRMSLGDLGSNPSTGIAASIRASVGPLAGLALPQTTSETGSTHLPRSNADDPLPTRKQSVNLTAVPSSSILLNPIRKSSQILDPAAPTLIVEDEVHTKPDPISPPTIPGPLPPAPVVTHIPAVPTEKELLRQKEKRERDKAREREERERKEREAREAELEMEIQFKEEKVWGIPKKAFYLGLGSVPGALNFNAHMAMMAGWGNGSGGPSDFTPPPPQRTSFPASKVSARGKTVALSKKEKSSKSKPRDEEATATSVNGANTVSKRLRTEEEDIEEERLDPEELAALNAIINTRRSMAAAQALASGQVKLPAPKRPVRSHCGSVRQGSQDSVPTRASDLSTAGESEQVCDRIERSAPSLASKNSSGSVTGAGVADEAGAKIRFAPLPKHSPIGEDPHKVSLPQDVLDHEGDTNFGHSGETADDTSWRSLDFSGRRSRSRDSFEVDSFAGADSDGDSDCSDTDVDGTDEEDHERWKRQMSRAKGKWYLMGLPPPAFKSSDYYRAWKRWSHEANASGLGSGGPSKTTVNSASRSAEASLAEARSNSLEAGRKGLGSSTGLASSYESERSCHSRALSDAAMSLTFAANEEGSRAQQPITKRGRRRKGSASRPNSARSASLSGDEGERSRRRKLILSARPGGTGMVTLPDGTRVKARRVGDGETDADEVPCEEWGFAGLAGLAKGQKSPEERKTDDADGDYTPTKDVIDAAKSDDKAVEATACDDQFPPSCAASPKAADDAATDRTKSSQLGAALALSVQRAEEVRRRHEAEMAALGAEVLAAHHRKIEQAANPVPSLSPGNPQQAVLVQSESTKDTATMALNLSQESSHEESIEKEHSSASGAGTGCSRSMRGASRQSQTSLNSYRRRSSSEPKRTVFSPDTSLPRKPDARGYAVVPLPSELGLRPSRPREGRVWELSDDDDDPLPEEAPDSGSESSFSSRDIDAPEDKQMQGNIGDEDDEDDYVGMNEAEMAEEERRRAVHSKRATTSAAGMERMHVRSRSTSIAPGDPRPKVPVRRNETVDEGAPKRIMSADATQTAAHSDFTPHGTRRRGTSLSDTEDQLSRLLIDGSPSYVTSFPNILPSSALASDETDGALPARRNSMLRNTKSSPIIHRQGHRRKAHKHGKSRRGNDEIIDDDLDLDLWPTSAALMLGMGLPGKRPPPAVLLAQAQKGRLVREKREREMKEAELNKKKKQEHDDDALDYGWPPTLKGSLYDR